MACYYPIKLDRPEAVQRVPCGRCIGCRLDYSRIWALRCVHESMMHSVNSFITLTYDDSSIRYGQFFPTLFKRDLQLFIKRLRKVVPDAIRYFACGEYGDDSYRPHYHAVVFGFDFPDRQFYSEKGGNRLYTSQLLSDCWGLGFCTVGDFSFESAAYVARYNMKKLLGKAKVFYDQARIEPEFAVMSRRPGIGRRFFEQYQSDIFPHDVCVARGGVKMTPPRYYSDIMARVDPVLMRSLKFQRRVKSLGQYYDKSTRRLAVREQVQALKIEALKRPL